MMNWIKVSGINLGLAVALGAFGAHGLKKIATPYELDLWHTATLYLFIHGLGILALGILEMTSAYRTHKIALTLQAGIILFSGTLYLMALGCPRWLGAITPIGGTLLIIGWLMLACIKKSKSSPL